MYNKLKTSIEMTCSHLYHEAVQQCDEAELEREENLSIQFHYEFSQGNHDAVRRILSRMDRDTTSYERHKLKLDVLEWWLFDYMPHKHGTVPYDVVHEKYQLIMQRLYEMLDRHRQLEKDNRNAYQMIRDHVFYFKMGLFKHSLSGMVRKCKKWFVLCGLGPVFYKKLMTRIRYVCEEYATYGRVCIGVRWDDTDTTRETVMSCVPSDFFEGEIWDATCAPAPPCVVPVCA